MATVLTRFFPTTMVCTTKGIRDSRDNECEMMMNGTPGPTCREATCMQVSDHKRIAKDLPVSPKTSYILSIPNDITKKSITVFKNNSFCRVSSHFRYCTVQYVTDQWKTAGRSRRHANARCHFRRPFTMWNQVYYSCTSRSVRRRLESHLALRLFIALVLLCIFALYAYWHGSDQVIAQEAPPPPLEQVLDMPIQEQKKHILRKKTKEKKVPVTAENKQVSCGMHFADSCAECPQGNGAGWCNGQCVWVSNKCVDRPSYVHPDYHSLLKEYPFQPVATETGDYLDIITVRAPFSSQRHLDLYEKYKDDILFLGISSFESFPLSSPNPYSANFSNSLYAGLFPGFLTMMHDPESYFLPQTKWIFMSQSDFNLDRPLRFGKTHDNTKKYDFTFSGTDQEVHNNCSECVRQSAVS